MNSLSPVETLSLFDGDSGPVKNKTIRMAHRIDEKKVISESEAIARWDRWWHEIDNITDSERGRNSEKTILSLFDESGEWSAPYVAAGYDVIQLDIQNGVDVMDIDVPETLFDACIDEVHGVLAACPCTHFANSGARWFAEKDQNGTTQEGIDLVNKTMQIIEFFQPEFWAIENP